MSGLVNPESLHIALTRLHTKEGVAQAFCDDLQEAVAYVNKTPSASGGDMLPIYGFAGSSKMASKGLIKHILRYYIHALLD